MAFSITGSLYNANLSAVGTNNVTVSTTPFVSTAFATSRIVALFSSAGTFKGVGYVRRFLSTSSLELESPIYDPANGNIATQVVGDQILVSKNALECVTAGFAVSGKTITITDQCLFGTSSAFNTVCFHDLDYNIVTNQQLIIEGGVVVFGKLNDYTTNQISGGVDIYSTMGWQAMPFTIQSSRAITLVYGGLWDSLNSPNYFNLGGNTAIFNSIECRQDLTGGGDPTRCKLINANLNTSSTNAILCRIGLIAVIGGRFKFNNGSANPIAVFGSDVAGNFVVGEVPGKRMIYSDNGSGRALTRSNTPIALNYDFTNFITADSRAVTGLGVNPLTPNQNGRNRFYFQDTYTNIQPQSAAIIKNSAGATLATTTITGTTWSPIVHHRTCIGATITVESTSWTYGIKRYGYHPIGGTITPSLYSLGVVGDADNVAFGGLVNQVVDTNVTLSESAAVAKLASSFVVNTTNNTIEVTAASTLDDLYDAMVAWSTRPVAAQLEYPSLSTQPVVANGDTLVTNMLVVGLQFLTSGTKFKKIQAANHVAGGAIANLSIVGNVTQATPTNLSAVSITGTLAYNMDAPATISLTNTQIGTVRNDGVGIITITRDATSSITNYADPEINFLNASAIVQLPAGFDVFSIYASSADALSESNPLFSGTAANNTIRYKAEQYGGQTIYIRPSDNETSGEVLIMPQLVSIGVGDYIFQVVSFSESSQLNTVIAQLTNLTTITAKENTLSTGITQLKANQVVLHNGNKNNASLVPPPLTGNLPHV